MSEDWGNCGKCKFYSSLESCLGSGIDEGLCRRYPPTIKALTPVLVDHENDHAHTPDQTGTFLCVAEHDWCGEYKKKVTSS